MTTEHKIIADQAFHQDRPTHVSLEVLHRWVIWQFPRPHKGGMMGAVHPPLSDHCWYPAIIKSADDEVVVHAHVEEGYVSPETAVLHFEKS